MERKTKSRKQAVAVGRGSRKPVRGKAGKEPTPGIPYEELKEFLEWMKEWWVHLGGDVSALEKLLHKLPKDQPLAPSVEKRFLALVKKTQRDSLCAYPQRIPEVKC
jgi:hypothetical protein